MAWGSRHVCALAMLAALAACVTVAPSVPFDKSSVSVQSIAVVGLHLPDDASAIDTVRVQDTAGATGGFIGSLMGWAIDASRESGRESKLKIAVDARGYDAQAVMEEALAAALEARGYGVSYIEATREKPAEYLIDFPDAPEGTQGFLDVVVEAYGYLHKGGQMPWRPMVWLKCRLVDASDYRVLMEKTIHFNPSTEIKEAVLLTPDETYAFETFDDVVADPDKALAGLDAAIAAVAEAVAMEL